MAPITVATHLKMSQTMLELELPGLMLWGLGLEGWVTGDMQGLGFRVWVGFDGLL